MKPQIASVLTSALLSLVLSGTALSGCASSPLRPDLPTLYDRSARHHGPDRNPVIVIPGILGSHLKDSATGQTVWGAFQPGFADPRDDESARLIALPIRQGSRIEDLRDSVVSDGALEIIELSVFGLPIELNAYYEIITSLGAGGYRDQQLGESGAIDYGEDHFTCFQFDYDWRRDAAESAAALHRYIIERRAYVIERLKEKYPEQNHDSVKFDIVAHSMGGLVARYYLRYGNQGLPADGSLPELTWAGAEYVEKVILVGTPNAGSIESFLKLGYGAKYAPILPRYPPALLATMPSLYVLLPRPRHQRILDKSTGEAVDLYDPEAWEKLKWGLANPEQSNVIAQLLPEVSSEEKRRAIVLDHQKKCLDRAERIHKALDLPAKPPADVRVSLIAGDALLTDSVISIDPNSRTYTVLKQDAGDGVVLRESALLDERADGEWSPRLRSPIYWDKVMFLFADHLDMTKSPSFTDNVLFELLEAPIRQ